MNLDYLRIFIKNSGNDMLSVKTDVVIPSKDGIHCGIDSDLRRNDEFY